MSAARSGVRLVCITPHSSGEPPIQEALYRWMGPPVSTQPTFFWLNKAEFERVHLERTRDVLSRRRHDVRTPETVQGSYQVGLTRFGQEFHIGPGGELARLLSRS